MSELNQAYSYFVSNTGYRFITKRKTSFYISVPKPEGGYMYRSIGFVRIGEKKALRKAIKVRNNIGKNEWGRFWDRIKREFNLLSRLPKSLEPRYYRERNKNGSFTEYYVARYTKYGSYLSRDKLEHSIKVSITCHGKLAAWTIAKRKLMDAHSDVLDILFYREAVSSLRLR